MIQTDVVKDFYSRIIGYIETDSVTGNKVGKDFYRRIVGYYNKNLNITQDFYKRTVGRGDLLTSLIIKAEEKNKR